MTEIKMDKIKIYQFVESHLNSYFGITKINEGLPPGFTSNDIESTDEYINKSSSDEITEADEKEPLLQKDDPEASPADMDPMLKKKKEFGGKSDHETPYIHRSAFTVIDDKNAEIDLDKLRNIITKRPTHILTQNAKIKKSGDKSYIFFNLTLPAYRGLWYDEKNKEFKIVTTCPSAGECKQICYARKGGYVQFNGSFSYSAQILNFLLNDWKGFKQQLISEIKQFQNQYSGEDNTQVVLRWHDSGDFFNEKYLQIALDIARETPEVIHYAYTKSINIVSKANKPKNFVFNYSTSGKLDDLIKKEDKKSVIVPKSIFKDLFPQKGAHLDLGKPITPKILEILRDRLSNMYSIPRENIITYKQLLKIPYDINTAIPKWHVVVKKGDGDDAASRSDVITTMLFIH